MKKKNKRLSPIVTDAEGRDTIAIYAHDIPYKNRFFKQHPEMKGIVLVCTGKDDQKTIQRAIDANKWRDIGGMIRTDSIGVNHEAGKRKKGESSKNDQETIQLAIECGNVTVESELAKMECM